MFQQSSRTSKNAFSGKAIAKKPVDRKRLRNRSARQLNTRKRAFMLVIVLGGVSIACSLSGVSSAKDITVPGISSTKDLTPDSISGDGSMVEVVRSIIAEIGVSNPSSLAAANDLLELDADAVPVLLNLLDSPDVLDRWAGMYALNLLAQPEDIPQIVKLLDEPILSIRARVAATLMMLGDARGLPILEEALLSDKMLLFSEPPILLSEYARQVLDDLGAESLGQRPIEGPNIGLQQYSAAQDNQQRGGAGVLASLAPAAQSDVSVSVSDCIINIELNLQFNGKKASTALAATWAEGIISVWNSELSSYGCSIDLVVNTKVDQSASPTEDPNYAQIKIIDLPPGYRGHIAEMGGTGGKLVRNEITGTWDYRTNGLLAAHEIGHALGNEDEYEFVKKDGQPTDITPNRGLSAEIQADVVGPGDKSPSIMYLVDTDKEGDSSQARVRHVDQILKAYKVSCICNGMVEWGGEYQGINITYRIITCDSGKTWNGTYEYKVYQWQGLWTGYIYSEYELLFGGGSMEAETEFVAEGTITMSGVPFNVVDQVTLAMKKLEPDPKYPSSVEIKIDSEGTQVSSGGFEFNAGEFLVAIDHKMVVLIEPYEDC